MEHYEKLVWHELTKKRSIITVVVLMTDLGLLEKIIILLCKLIFFVSLH